MLQDSNKPQESPETVVAAASDAESDARGASPGTKDPDLTTVVDAWPYLPQAIKTAILAMIHADKRTTTGPAGRTSGRPPHPTSRAGASGPDEDELRALAAKADHADLRKMEAILRETGTILRRAGWPKEKIARLLDRERARRLKRLAQLPAKRKRRRDKQSYQEAQDKKAMERWEQAKKTS